MLAERFETDFDVGMIASFGSLELGDDVSPDLGLKRGQFGRHCTDVPWGWLFVEREGKDWS